MPLKRDVVANPDCDRGSGLSHEPRRHDLIGGGARGTRRFTDKPRYDARTELQRFTEMSKFHQSRTDNISPSRAGWAVLLPVMGTVFVAFLVIGMAMPVLPRHLHEVLGLGTYIVGLIAGGQLAAIPSWVWVGRQSDTRRPKISMIGTALAVICIQAGMN